MRNYYDFEKHGSALRTCHVVELVFDWGFLEMSRGSQAAGTVWWKASGHAGMHHTGDVTVGPSWWSRVMWTTMHLSRWGKGRIFLLSFDPWLCSHRHVFAGRRCGQTCLLSGFLWLHTKVLILFQGSHRECGQAHSWDQRLALVCVGRSLFSPRSPGLTKSSERNEAFDCYF